MVRNKFNELAKAKIQEKRNVVISELQNEDGSSNFTIAQQLEVQEGNKVTNMYMKSAMHIDDIEGLYNLRDALNVAILKMQDKEPENDGWDE